MIICNCRVFHHHPFIHSDEMPPEIRTMQLLAHRSPIQPCDCNSNKCNEKHCCNNSNNTRNAYYSSSRNSLSLCQSMRPQMQNNYVSVQRRIQRNHSILHWWTIQFVTNGNHCFVILDLNSGMSNYELLNNVPPNVSLQRSANVVPDTQLSPGFSPTLLQQQLSPNQRAPFSPQSNQSIGYQSFTPNTGQNQVQFCIWLIW